MNLQPFADCLSSQELQRAETYRLEAGRRSFIIGRASLRTVLGKRLNIPPAEIAFRYGPYGKPHVVGETGKDRIHFSVTNTRDFVAIAVSPAQIGFDMEQLSSHDYRDLYGYALSPSERLLVEWTPKAQRERTFLQIWTRKEALLKAMGTGLSDNLVHVDVFAPGHIQLLRTVGHDGASTEAQLVVSDIRLEKTCVAAVALEAPVTPVAFHSLMSLYSGAASVLPFC